LRYMRILAGAMQGRSPQDGFRVGRSIIDGQFAGLEQQILTPEIRAVASRLPSDPYLPADVRQKYSVAWNLCEEMRGYVEKPLPNSASYVAKAQDCFNKLRNEVFPFVQSLGYDPNADDVDDKDK